jgi:SAM-dependent methyltransferase
VSFAVPAEGYDRFMGRYLPSLGPQLADIAGVREGMTVLDVGCGPGGLTRELAERVGAERVAAIDPSRAFVAACRERVPGADVREGSAEELPFEDGSFDAVLSSLVIHFMSDPAAGCREMARVARPGGVVAACVWDLRGGGMTMLKTFWEAARSLEPATSGEDTRVGGREGEIAELFAAAGMEDVEGGDITATASYEGFDDWWEPFTLGVGPAGGHVAKLDDERRAALREACRERLGKGDEPFELDARAWYARGRAPSA